MPTLVSQAQGSTVKQASLFMIGLLESLIGFRRKAFPESFFTEHLMKPGHWIFIGHWLHTILLFYTWGNWGSQKLTELLKVMSSPEEGGSQVVMLCVDGSQSWGVSTSPGKLVDTEVSGSHPLSFWFSTSSENSYPRTCISNELPGDAQAVDMGFILWELLPYVTWLSCSVLCIRFLKQGVTSWVLKQL